MLLRTLPSLSRGESGTGKELVAHAIHEISRRRHKPLKIINTGAIPEGLIESELFGAEKGAYTGATERRTGLFEEADGGSVFLDEIGEMPAAAQVRLLRVLESGTFNRVGSSRLRETDIRVIAATNKNLGKEVEAGRFREDLYYRLSTVIIQIPPLRERREDILPIFKNFLYKLSQKYRSPQRELNLEAERLLQSYHWPGNVRELRNVAEQVVVLHRSATVDAAAMRPFLRGVTANKPSMTGLIKLPSQPQTESSQDLTLIYRALLDIRAGIQDLRREVIELARHPEDSKPPISYPPLTYEQEHQVEILDKPTKHHEVSEELQEVTYTEVESPRPNADRIQTDTYDELPTLKAAELALINRALKIHDGNRKATARALGISQRTLYRKLKELDDSAL